jgi:hypothetical protein
MNMRLLLPCLSLAAALAACVSTGAVPDTLDAAARDYVRLQMAIGEKEEGYIDAFYGPAELAAEGKAIAASEDLPKLLQRVDALSRRIGSLAGPDNRRAVFLRAQLTAAETRLRMLQGEKLSFDEEARGLFGVAPQLKPLSAYDPVLAELERLVPGTGELADRVDAFQERFTIAPARLKPVFDAAIAECKARTLRHIKLPDGEQFDMSFVTGKSWSGYNYYQGGYRSRIEINTDLPIRISRAVDLGCHEGYPGHHALGVLIEKKLTRRGRIEHSVFPLYSPQAIIAEGSANYGIELAFPEAQKAAYEASTLYPLAGLPAAEARRYDALLDAMKQLSGARMTIAKDFVEGRITESEAVALTRKYQLVSEKRAKQSVAFTKQYRSYVINYGLGLDMVRADVERLPAGPARWKRFEEIISEPTLPSDLRAR